MSRVTKVRTKLAAALRDDAADPVYRWLWRPMLVLQLANLVRVFINFSRNRSYQAMVGAADATLHQNHVGNVIALKAQPNPWLLTVHLGMALTWVAGTLVQKGLVARAARANPSVGPRDGGAAANVIRIHRVMGWILSIVGMTGIIAGFLIAFFSHGHEAMRRFLLTQPLFFLPPMVMVLVSARKRGGSIRTHRFWAQTAYLGPALATLWTEILINLFGRVPSIGPRGGDLLGSELAAVLGAALVIVPAWLARRRGLALDARAMAVPVAARAPAGG